MFDQCGGGGGGVCVKSVKVVGGGGGGGGEGIVSREVKSVASMPRMLQFVSSSCQWSESLQCLLLLLVSCTLDKGIIA